MSDKTRTAFVRSGVEFCPTFGAGGALKHTLQLRYSEQILIDLWNPSDDLVAFDQAVVCEEVVDAQAGGLDDGDGAEAVPGIDVGTM